MLFVLMLMPMVAAPLTFFLSSNRSRMVVLVATAVVHLSCVASFWRESPAAQWQNFLSLDVLGLFVLSIISVLFTVVSCYLIGYLKEEEPRSNAMFITCLLIFLSAMTLVTVSRHFGLLWIAIEATTLFGTNLINFHRTPRAIEATWKCLLICSVGIALALLGTLFLAVAAIDTKTLLFEDLFSQASTLSGPWLKLSVIFLLVGYGTKMGLAPMHSWKPDTYGEAPGPVGALFSGALTSCAFLAMLRIGQVCYHADQMSFFQSILLLLGMLSLPVAGIFMLGQTDFKRMLGYSSIEHMGILAVGIGLGATGFYGGVFHMFNNAMAKGLMFLAAGNLYRQYQSSKSGDIQGILHRYPLTGVLLLVGFFCVTGFPPFGTFFSVLMILNAALAGRYYVIAFFFVIFLAIIFIGMSRMILSMVFGVTQDKLLSPPQCERMSMIIPMVILGSIVLGTGIYMPSWMDNALREISGLLGG